MNPKPMRSKFDKLFALAPIAKAREGDVVFISFEEWAYIKANRQIFTSEKFDEILRARYHSHHSRIIPDFELDRRRQVAQQYGGAILEMLAAKKKSG